MFYTYLYYIFFIYYIIRSLRREYKKKKGNKERKKNENFESSKNLGEETQTNRIDPSRRVARPLVRNWRVKHRIAFPNASRLIREAFLRANPPYSSISTRVDFLSTNGAAWPTGSLAEKRGEARKGREGRGREGREDEGYLGD